MLFDPILTEVFLFWLISKSGKKLFGFLEIFLLCLDTKYFMILHFEAWFGNRSFVKEWFKKKWWKAKQTIDLLCYGNLTRYFCWYYYVKLVISHVMLIKRHFSWLTLGMLWCSSSVLALVPKKKLNIHPSLSFHS